MKVKHVDHRRANLRTKYVGGEFAQVNVEHVDQQEVYAILLLPIGSKNPLSKYNLE
jgi:hypothetical protein